jgi:ABC-type Na+ efflux pump permease subunit
MKKFLLFLLFIVITPFLLAGVQSCLFLSAAPVERPKSFLNNLHEGQAIILSNKDNSYFITILEPEIGIQKITSIGTDYIVIDEAGVREVIIPIYSIRSIIKTKVKK